MFADFAIMFADFAIMFADFAIMFADFAIMFTNFAIMFADFAIMFADFAIMFADLAILFADLAILFADFAIMFADLAIMFADSRPESTFWIFGKPNTRPKVSHVEPSIGEMADDHADIEETVDAWKRTSVLGFGTIYWFPRTNEKTPAIWQTVI
ncbi:hypothetical protein M8J77_006789 [Diaphorina citri]|nr:hypothetical protein M8J77_006789 [Diaphorina citri]